MNRLVHESTVDLGTIPYAQGIMDKVTNSTWLKSNVEVPIVLPNGETKVVSLDQAGLLLVNLTRARGNVDAWQGQPKMLLSFNEGMLSRISNRKKEYEQVPDSGPAVVIPLGFPTNQIGWNLTMECSREWIGGGECLTAWNMEHVINMQMHVLKDLVLAAAIATKVSEQKRLFIYLCAMALSIRQYYQDTDHTVAKRAIDALANSAVTEDALQRLLALAFVPLEPTDREILEIVELSIKRAYKRQDYKESILANPVCLTILYLGRLVRRLVQSDVTIEQVRQEFEKFAAEMTILVGQSLTKDTRMLDDGIIAHLIKNLRLGKAGASVDVIKFVAYCRDYRNFHLCRHWIPLG